MPKIEVRKEQYPLLAMMVVEGYDHQAIADAISIPVKTARRFAGGNGPDGFNAVLDELRSKFSKAVVQARFDFIDLQNKAMTAIREALESEDKRLAAEHAWKVIAEILPKPEKGAGVEVNMQINSQTNTVNAQIASVSKDLLGAFKDLKKLDRPGYERHVMTGLDGLPEPMRKAMEAADRADAIDAEIIEDEPVDVPEGAPDTPEEHPRV